uniref:spidroin-1-like n=1 Tax=Callithrix jacchus TaxID=9483 RepID=UPI0023DD3A6D|nr:spidroin-1-like [Callithrix jacchus]
MVPSVAQQPECSFHNPAIEPGAKDRPASVQTPPTTEKTLPKRPKIFHHPPSRSLYPVLPPHPPFSFFFFFHVLPFPPRSGSDGKGRGSREGQGWLLRQNVLFLVLPRFSPSRGSPLAPATSADSRSESHANSFPGARRGRAGRAGARPPSTASRGPASPEPWGWLISSPAGPGGRGHVGASSRGPGLRAAAAAAAAVSSVLSLLRLPRSERGTGALQTRTLTHAHTRASSCQSKPCNPRARTPGGRGRRQKEKKERGGGESQAAAAAAAGAEATSSPGKASSGGGGSGAHPDQLQHLHPRSWELERAVPGGRLRGATRRERVRARARGGLAACARGGRSRGQSRGQNESPAGGRRELREPGRGLAPGKGEAGKTRIWSARGLRGAGST